jgi:hypothetical protein
MWPRNAQALLQFKQQVIQYAVEFGKCATGTHFTVDVAIVWWFSRKAPLHNALEFFFNPALPILQHLQKLVPRLEVLLSVTSSLCTDFMN